MSEAHDEKEAARFNSGEHSRGFWWRPEMASASGNAWISLLALAAGVVTTAVMVKDWDAHNPLGGGQ